MPLPGAHSVDGIKFGQLLVWDVQVLRCEVLAEVGKRTRARDRENVRRTVQQPGERHLTWRRA